MEYDKYDLHATARRALNYIVSMVDPNRDFLPYWLITPLRAMTQNHVCPNRSLLTTRC